MQNSIRRGWALLTAAALVAGCGAASSQGTGTGDASGGPGTRSGGTSSGGTSSGGSGSDGSGGSGGTICSIATLGYKGQWGDGNVFTDWLQNQATGGTTGIEAQELTASLLAPFQVIVVQDVRPGSGGQAGVGQGIGRTYSAAEVEVLKQWVAAGGGLMTLIGYGDSSEITNANRLLEPFGLSYGSAGILSGGGGYTVPVTHWADHPIAAGITKIGVDNGYAVLGGGTLVAWEPTPGQNDVGRAVESGSGRVFAWADEWITYNSEWTQKPDYQVAKLWANALTWLKGSNGCQVPVPPGEW